MVRTTISSTPTMTQLISDPHTSYKYSDRFTASKSGGKSDSAKRQDALFKEKDQDNSPSIRTLKKKISSLSQSSHATSVMSKSNYSNLSMLEKESPSVQSVLSAPPVMAEQSKFNSLSNQINDVLANLNNIYCQIGYSSTEVSIKKNQIFNIIRESIDNYSVEATREKITLEGECEWLRSQIKAILGLIDDKDGLHNFSMSERGLVLNNLELLRKGLLEEELTRRKEKSLKKQQFFENSPFNITPTNLSFDTDRDINLPSFSLLQTKAKLNELFLISLQKFNILFLKLNKLNMTFQDIYKRLEGDYKVLDVTLVKMLPKREDSEYFLKLYTEWENTLNSFDFLSKDRNIFHANINISSNIIVSSPKKITTPPIEFSNQESTASLQRKSEDEIVNKLQDLNSNIIKIIKNLTFSKLSNEYFNKLEVESTHLKGEFESRVKKIKSTISECLSIIKFMNLDDRQLTILQKKYDIENNLDSDDKNDGYFTAETLDIIYREPEHYGLTKLHIDHLSSFYTSLNKLRIERQTKYDELIKECKFLWNKLQESEDYSHSILVENENLSERSIKNLGAELARLLQIKRENIKIFIDDIRQKLDIIWDKLFYSDEQKMSFHYFKNHEYNDEVLEAHERELLRLEELYETYKPILSSINQLEGLLQEKRDLEESSKDSSRLLSRASSKILLQEERTRKKLSRYLPNLIDSTKARLINFQYKNNGVPLIINGEVYLDKLMTIESGTSSSSIGNRSKRTSPIKNMIKKLPNLSRQNSKDLQNNTSYKILGSFSSIRKPTPKSNNTMITQSTSRRQLLSKNKATDETPIRRTMKHDESNQSSLRKSLQSFENLNSIFRNQDNFDSSVGPKSNSKTDEAVTKRSKSPVKILKSILSPSKKININNSSKHGIVDFKKNLLKRHLNHINDDENYDDSFNVIDSNYESWKREKLRKLNYPDPNAN